MGRKISVNGGPTLKKFKGGFECLGSFGLCIYCFTYGLVWFVGEELEFEKFMIFFIHDISFILLGARC